MKLVALVELFDNAAKYREQLSLSDEELDVLIKTSSALVKYFEHRGGERSLLMMLRNELNIYQGFRDSRKRRT